MAFAGKVLTLGCLLGFGVSGFNLGFRVEGSGYPLLAYTYCARSQATNMVFSGLGSRGPDIL